MIVRCVGCGWEGEARTGIPASKNIPREQGVTVCPQCGGIWARYVSADMWGEGIVLGDGHRYFRASDLPASSPVLEWPVKHFNGDGPIYWAPLRDDPDMLVARA